MAEQRIAVGTGVELCYELFERPDPNPADPTILLVMGLGTQMLGWRQEFCESLAAEGFRVIRYDNRDIGQSTHFSHKAPPKPLELMLRRPRDPAYTLDDMADDAAALLSALGIGRAHVVGASMGGMIAQRVAIRHPEKVASLVSIMSTTGATFVGHTSPKVFPFLLKPPTTDRAETIDRVVALFGLIGSPGFTPDVEAVRQLAGDSFDRTIDRRGAGRQLAAILASGNRTKALASITAPTLVIHGAADRMVAPSGGRATAKAIPGARLEIIEGMGHDLPRELWPRVTRLIVDQARAADSGAATLSTSSTR